MILRILRPARHAGWLALLASCAAAIACNSNQPAAAQAYVDATIGNGSQVIGLCNFAGARQTVVGIGVATGSNPTRVKDGDTQSGSYQAHITCTVTPSGNGFDVSLNATLEGPQGGSITIQSPPGQGAVTTNGASGVTGVFQAANSGSYRENDCTITYTYNGGPVPDSPPIAAGRIWGHISCPTATDSSQTTTGHDGGSSDVMCDGEADFLFEQCGQ